MNEIEKSSVYHRKTSIAKCQTPRAGVIVYVNEAICMRKIAALSEFHGFAPSNLRWISIYGWLILHKVI